MSSGDAGVLVVDDSKMMRHVMMGMLHEFGYAIVFEAESVAAARTVLEDKNVFLILSDWHMPGGTGLELLHYVREQRTLANTAFVMLTTENQRENIFEAAKSGVHAFVFKPPERGALFEKLAALSGKCGFPAPHRPDETTSGKRSSPVVPDTIRGLTDDTELSLGFRLSDHDAVVSLDAGHPLAAELKKIYPDARFIRIISGSVETECSIAIQKWNEEKKRLGATPH